MAGDASKNERFGDIAVEMNFIKQIDVHKAMVVQERIFEKTRVSMSIAEILIEMGVITADARNEILQMQRAIEGQASVQEPPSAAHKKRKPRSMPGSEGSHLDITVSKDKLTAFASIEGGVPVSEFDVNDVKIMLHADSILHGIAEDSQIEAFLNGKLSAGEPWTIASGTEPIPETPPQIKYHFDTDPLKVGTLTENGLMDWKERGQLPQVKEGALLAEKIPGANGKEGMDVYGKKIPIPKRREKRFKCGKGARRSENGMQVHATLAGIPKLSITGDISVMPTLHIQGDISLETGHVEFDGHIEVAGAVEKGYRVKGGSLRATEIRDAQIDIEGDISATNGIFGARIRCGGNLKAGHIHNATIAIAGDLAVEKEIIESRIEANGRCLISDGIIISSTVSAKMGISAMDIGTEASKSSELVVGIDQQLEREAESIREEIQRLKAERENLPKLLENLNKRSDQVNTRLGEVAQEQDKCMVQHRRLEEKVEAALLKQGGAAAEKLKKTIIDLKAKQDAYDQDVVQLMDEDESISQEIANTETAIRESASTVKELNVRLDGITAAKKANTGVATIRIAGKIYPGTSVTGPHSTLILQEALKGLSIVETDKPDHDGVKRWRFEINPFR
ncbi:MAG: FapA family protein [Desulfosarcina sp.]|jgi:hypothetical protein